MYKKSYPTCFACLQNQTHCTSHNDELRSIYKSLTSLQIDTFPNIHPGFCKLCAKKLIDFESFRMLCLHNFHILVSTRNLETSDSKKDQFPEVDRDSVHVAKCDISSKVIKLHPDQDNLKNAPIRENVICNLDEKSSMVKNINRSKILVCVKCPKKFKKKDRLEAHLRVHDGKKPEVCKVCSSEFSSWKSLKLHSMIHTGEKKYVCAECGQKFTYPTALKIHKRLHSGLREYICDICGNTFFTSTNLKLHMVIHKEDRPFPCKFCDKKFKCSNNLRVHEFRHTGVKDFICSQCGHRSITKGELTSHMKTHSAKKSFICCICSKTYRTAHELKIHNRMHTD